MSLILRGFGELANDMIQISRRGVSAIAVRMYAAGNALFEALTGDPASGATRRDVASHDHTPGKGLVIPRGGCCFGDIGEDLSTSSAWSNTIAIADMGSYFAIIPREPNFKVFVTPGIDSGITALHGGGCQLENYILVEVDLTGGATSVDFRWYNRTTNSYSAVQNVASSSVSWLSFSDIPTEGGIWNDLDLEIRGNGPGGSSVARVSMYSFSMAETRLRSQPQSDGSYIYNDPAAPRP